jgi:hypothetical protein
VQFGLDGGRSWAREILDGMCMRLGSGDLVRHCTHRSRSDHSSGVTSPTVTIIALWGHQSYSFASRCPGCGSNRETRRMTGDSAPASVASGSRLSQKSTRVSALGFTGSSGEQCGLFRCVAVRPQAKLEIARAHRAGIRSRAVDLYESAASARLTLAPFAGGPPRVQRSWEEFVAREIISVPAGQAAVQRR